MRAATDPSAPRKLPGALVGVVVAMLAVIGAGSWIGDATAQPVTTGITCRFTRADGVISIIATGRTSNPNTFSQPAHVGNVFVHFADGSTHEIAPYLLLPALRHPIPANAAVSWRFEHPLDLRRPTAYGSPTGCTIDVRSPSPGRD